MHVVIGALVGLLVLLRVLPVLRAFWRGLRRVLGVTAVAERVELARVRAYEATSHITFDGMQLRSDIAASA